MSSLKKVKLTTQMTKDRVFGFVRRIEQALESYRNIPVIISYLCLAYYSISEYFDKARTDCFKITDDKLTITNIKKCIDEKHTIFMKQWIDSQCDLICEWLFKINTYTQPDCMCIGWGEVKIQKVS